MAAPWDGRLVSYLGSGTVAARPVAPNIAPGVLGVWFATDTVVISYWDSTGLAWFDYPTPQTVEQTQDMIATLLVAGTNMSIVYDDGAGTITLNGQSNESIQDMLSTFLVAGTNVTLTYDDGANTLTIAATTPSLDLDDLADVDTTGVSDGEVLTYDSGDSTWKAAAPTGGGGAAWYFDPPVAADFPNVGRSGTETTDFTLTDDADVGLIFENPNWSSTGDRMRWATQALPGGDWKATIHIAELSLLTATNYSGVGIVLREVATNKSIQFNALKWDSGSEKSAYDYWNTNGTSYAGTTVAANVRPCGPRWLQIEKVSTTLHFRFSYNGKKWITLGSPSLTAHFTTAPDQIGPSIVSNAIGTNGGAFQHLTVDHWEVV